MKIRFTLGLLACLLIAWIAAYPATYFAAQIKTVTGTNDINSFTIRYYSSDWQVVLFQPAAQMESAIRQHDVPVAYEFQP
jgi:hypothetical protein